MPDRNVFAWDPGHNMIYGGGWPHVAVRVVMPEPCQEDRGEIWGGGFRSCPKGWGLETEISHMSSQSGLPSRAPAKALTSRLREQPGFAIPYMRCCAWMQGRRTSLFLGERTVEARPLLLCLVSLPVADLSL